MKRKLFTLLAAFMALATFQSNAQTGGGVAPYDGQTLHYLNVWTAGQQRAGHAAGDCFVDTYPSRDGIIHETAKDYPLSADMAQSPAGTYTGKALFAMKYVFNVQFNKWELTNNDRLGTVGDVDTYFTLQRGTGDKYNTFIIRSKSPKVVGDVGNRIFFTKSNGEEVNEFVFLRFQTENGDEYDGINTTANAATVKDSVGMVPWVAKYSDPKDGGYLAANILAGRNTGGENDRSQYVVAYDTTLNVNGAPNNRYAIYSMDEVRKNWADISNGVKKVRIVPVWVKASTVGGRWATKADFPDEFIKFPIQKQSTPSYFTVKNISIFKVDSIGALKFGTNGSEPSATVPLVHPTADAGNPLTDMFRGDNPTAATTGETSRLHNDGTAWELQYFTIANPCNGELLQVNREVVPELPLSTGEGQFGNQLTFNKWYTAPSTTFPGATVSELQRTQQFAIWINESGNMELYPLNSWTRETSQNVYKTTAPTSPNFNYAVWMDRPYATTANSGIPANFNNSFKISMSFGKYCTGPVSGTSTTFSNLELRPEKAILINQIQEGRYYFIQMKATPKANFYAYTAAGVKTTYNDSIYVLDLVRTAGGKRVVMTPAESDRFDYTRGDTKYFSNPYDSVNMSAHWRFVRVAGGYQIINQLGDTLQYDHTGMTVVGTQSAYIPATTALSASVVPGSYTSNVWQSVHLNCYDGFFKLRNMAESTTERPALDMPYLDTVRTAAYTGLVDGSSYYWYAGLRGRTSASSHLQKDVRLVGSATLGIDAGMQFKVTEVGYEYAPGGDNGTKTNHTNDGYYPSDDSLCVYLYKEGNYSITEATSLNLSIKDGFNGADPVYGQNLAHFVLNEQGQQKWLWTEPVESRNNPNLPAYKYMVPMTYTDASGVEQLNVDYMLTSEQMRGVKANANVNVTEWLKLDKGEFNAALNTTGFNVDNYKWHYVKNASGQYMVYDTINTQTELASQQFGFKFKTTDRSNATMFRFYQPLVGDKSKENFIMEFRVAKHEYTDYRSAATPNSIVRNGWDNIYATDNYGINPFVTTAGLTTPTNSATMTPGNNTSDYTTLVFDVKAAGTNMADQTKWTPTLIERYLRYLNYERAARTKFVLMTTASDPVFATWNDGRNKATGAPQAATRFKFTGPDATPCAKDYVDTKYLLDNQLYANPTVKAAVMNVYDPSSTVATVDSISAKAADSNGKIYADNNTKALRLLITQADVLKVGSTTASGVPNGYLSRFAGTSAANSRYNQYENTREVELYYIQHAIDTTLYLTIDSTSLYAETMGSTLDGVSGMKLTWSKKFTSTSQKGSTVGETADYRPLQMFAIYGCKTTTSAYGNFILIPAASWEFNYTTRKHTTIKANTRIGNTSVVDEFRISEGSTKGSNGINYMIVMPSSETNQEGVTPTEYTFTRDPYANTDYFCEKNSQGQITKHSFVQRQGFLPSVKATGLFEYSYKLGGATSAKDYNDPSMHWTICKDDKGLYTFTPESDDWDANGEKVPARNQLLEQYYFVPMNVNNYAIGDVAVAAPSKDKPQVFMAIPKNNPGRENILTVTITRMTETEGDECITAFKKFSTDDLHYDWSILESIYTDRYVYSKGMADGSGYVPGDMANAYYAQATGTTTPKTVQYLRIRESNTTYQNEKNNDTVYHHSIPYYNIIHVVYYPETQTEEQYYLEMGWDEKANAGKGADVVRFRHLTDREKFVVEHYDQYPDTMQAVKFCFPYKLNSKGEATTTLSGYTDKNVAVRTMPRQNQVFWLGVDASDTSNALAVKDSTRADVFVFGPNANSDEEWIGNADKSGWLKDYSRSDASSIYLVEPSGADPVNYGLLSYISNVLPDINDGNFTFKMVLDTIINKYTKTHIWYYQIINKQGKLLTYKPLAGATSDYKYGDYTYAYFADAAANANVVTPTNNQVFGFLINKGDAKPGHGYPFWVVAQASSGSYKYLGQNNNRMVFFPTLSDNKKEAQKKAMTFEIGKVDNGKFTGKDDVTSNTVAVYGVEGAVKVANAEGAIELYTIDGRQFKSVLATGGEQTISAPRGVVIVKVAGKATKVVVK